jgi:hypothetical protein
MYRYCSFSYKRCAGRFRALTSRTAVRIFSFARTLCIARISDIPIPRRRAPGTTSRVRTCAHEGFSMRAITKPRILPSPSPTRVMLLQLFIWHKSSVRENAISSAKQTRSISHRISRSSSWKLRILSGKTLMRLLYFPAPGIGRQSGFLIT